MPPNNDPLTESVSCRPINKPINKAKKETQIARCLSRSLRSFYDEQYRVALSEVNIAIDLNPELQNILNIAYSIEKNINFKNNINDWWIN